MSVEGLNSILKQREAQFGPMIGEKVDEGDTLAVLEEIKQAIGVVASNQQKIYAKLDELEAKIEGK